MATTQYGVSILQGGQSIFGQTVETFHEREHVVHNFVQGSNNVQQVALNPSAENAHVHEGETSDGYLKFFANPDNPASPATGSEMNTATTASISALNTMTGV